MRHWRIGMVVLVALGVVGLALYRAGAFRGRTGEFERTREESLAQAAREYAKVRVEPIASPGPFFESTAFTGSSPEAGATANALRRAAEEFVRRRFADDDFDAYVRWRESLGCRLRSREELQRKWQIREDYAALLGEQPADDLDVRGYMRAMWPLGLGRGDGFNRPVAIATDDLGTAGGIAVVRDPADLCLVLSGRLGTDLWHGPMVSSMRRWLDPPNSPADLVKRHGSLTVGQVNVIVELHTGERNPYLLCFFYDPELRRWYLHEVGRSHFSDMMRTTPLEF